MGEVHHEAVVAAPRDKVFAYVNDYKNVPEFFFGLSNFNPVTEQTSGVGAQFETEIKVGPKSLKSVVTCTDWTENETIKLKSISGFGANTAWAFADGPDAGTTKLTVQFEYHLPGGLAGKVLGGLIGPFADQAVKYTETKVKAALES